MPRKQRREVYKRLERSQGAQAVRDLRRDVAEVRARLAADGPSA